MTKFILPLATLLLVGAIWNPSNLLMPPMAVNALLVLLVVACGVYAIFFFLEAPRDEREADHARSSDRIALLCVGSIILIGIVIGEVHGVLDNTLLMALFVLVLGKSVAKYYFEERE
jgi:uncharacterized membrane protein YoaK (UPF0700 family)